MALVTPSAAARFRFVLSAAWRTDRRRTAAIFALIAGESIAAGAVTIALKWIFDGIAAGDWTTVRTGVVVATAAQVFFLFGSRTRDNLQLLVSQRLAVEIDEDILRTVAGIASIEHHENPAYLDRLKLTLGQGGVLAGAAWAVINAVAVVARLSISVWLLISVDPLLALLPLFALPSIALASPAQRYVHRAQERSAEMARAEEHLHRLFLNPATSKELRVFGAEDTLDRDARALHLEVTRLLFKGNLQSALVYVVGWLIFGLGYFAGLLLLLRQATHQEARIGDLVLLTQLAALLRGQVEGAVAQVSSLSDALATVGRTMWLDAYAAQARHAGKRSAPDRLTRGVDLQNVSFRYPGTDRAVLTDINLRLHPGTTVALVGENGAGKTTLVKLLCGFYQPTGGSIELDGVDLREIDVVDWRNQLTACFQDFARLELVARETVGVGWLPEIDDRARVLAAVDRGTATDIVGQLQHGIDTPLGRTHWNGAELSGGQWQRLALARAMMREHPRLLVLDEPSAALDALAEHELFERYASAARRAAADDAAITVLVSHRFSTVRMADTIVVMENGAIVERGTHEELVELGGTYAELYQLQARSYR